MFLFSDSKNPYTLCMAIYEPVEAIQTPQPVE